MARAKMSAQKMLVVSGLAAALALAGVTSRGAQPAMAGGQKQAAQTQNHDHMQNMPGMKDMPGMQMDHGSGQASAPTFSGSDGENDPRTQSDAMHSMHHMHMDGPHMRMTAPRKATEADWTRADEVTAKLRSAIEKYKDYRLALADGYRIFMPNFPQPEYHFTSYENGFLESFTFNAARPTSLLYKKTKDGGWELTGAMYTAARSATLEQLNERVPLGVARWHAHTNLCMPARGQSAKADWTRFGLTGSISSEKACTEAGGRFYPQVFGWMVHVYPFESSREKIWGQ
jgi:hypothetical protein